MDRLLELTYRAEQSHFWFRGFRRFVRPELEAAAADFARPRLLDCGCGTGANIRMLREFGDALGFDVTWSGLQCARAADEPVACASIASIPFADASFDILTSFDVLQCVPDDVEQAGIREMWRVLRPGGHLILNVAALEMLSGGHAVLSSEFRRYNRASLRALVSDAGFRIERLTYVHAMLFPLMLPVRTWQRLANGHHSSGEFDISVPAKPINATLSALMRLEAVALRIIDMPIGSSLMCHARKPA